MDSIHVGIIGCGRIADLHYPGYKGHPQAKIYAVCDSDSEILARRKTEWGAEKAYRDYREMLADSRIDAVEILTPHHLHEKMVIEAARAGKHIAVQKPMTNDLASADRMLVEVKKAGIVYKVTENYVFYPPIVLARKLLLQGEIGEPISLRIKYIGGSSGGWAVPPASWEWRIKESAEGRGITTFDHGHHLWSTAWFLLGEPEQVYAWVGSADGIVDCPSVAIWKYKKPKVLGNCDFSFAPDLRVPSRYYSNDEWIEIIGQKGIIFLRRCTGNIQEGSALVLFDGSRMREFPEASSDWGDGFIGATNNFLSAIAGKESPLLSGEEARTVLRFSLAIQKSARLGREVYLAEMDKKWPWLHFWREKSKAKRQNGKNPIFSFLGLGDHGEKYSSQAIFLTEQLVHRFSPQAVGNWDCIVGLRLTYKEKDIPRLFTLTIHQGKASLSEGKLPEKGNLLLTMPAGIWAAILLKKKKIESAVLSGKIKIEGRAEEALKLKAAFGL